MRNKIIIDIETIRKQPNWGVTDYETIRQIAIYSIENPNDREISDKVDPKFAFAGLYPFFIEIKK